MDMREVDAPPQSDTVNFQTLEKMGYKNNSRGEWVFKVDSSEDSGGDKSAKVPPHSSTTHEQSSLSYTVWRESIDTSVESIDTHIGKIQDNIKKSQGSIDLYFRLPK
ncbi:hypothetical protein CJ030_MR1G003740 [Morella rubra]|uniref:Uncharacterized protein n=1 Tax=Morella rubra TaxID=262757 RepID=A0A6A1WNM5_9ROSI|nr:hypothetical protein CJ030_MR1G003740 [Morella rubra]